MGKEGAEGEKEQGKQPAGEAGDERIPDFERYDERWSFANQARDWLILFVIAAIWAGWMIIVYLLEPGIR